MEPSQTVVPATQPHRVNQVTTLSKFLTLALIVVLPFLGGYVGYSIAQQSVKSTPTKYESIEYPLKNVISNIAVNVQSGDCVADITNDHYYSAEISQYDYYGDHDGTYCFNNSRIDVDEYLFNQILRAQDNNNIDIFHQEKIRADVDTIGFDNKGIYIEGNRVLSSDSGDYTYYDEGRYIRIKDRVYTVTSGEMNIYGVYSFATNYYILPGTDATTFEYLGHGYARDAHALYYGRQVLAFDPQTFILTTLEIPEPVSEYVTSITLGIMREMPSNQLVVYLQDNPLYGIDPSQMYIGPKGRYIADVDTIYYLIRHCEGLATPTLGDLKDKDTYDNTSC